MLSIKNVTGFLEAMNLSAYQEHESFHILKFEDHFYEMPKKIALHSSGYFEITFVTQSSKGGAKLKIEQTVFEPRENSLSFVAPGQSTYVDVQGSLQDGNGYMLVFTTDFLEDAFSDFKMIQHFPFFNIHVSPVYYLDEKSPLILGLVETLYSEFQEKEDLRFELIQSYLKVLLLEIKRLALHYENPTHNRAQEVTFTFENLVKKTPSKHQQVGYYADQMHISPVYLSQCIKNVTGLTVKQLIDKYVIMEAVSLLEFSTLNVGEIGFQLGFEDRSNFINFFKRQTGFTPKQYLSKNR